MRGVLILFLIILTACNALYPQTEGRVYCKELRDDVCAAVYEPVCADNSQTYSNACVACTDSTVSYSDPGACR